MTIRESAASQSFFSSHRTLPEQLVGLGIYLSLSLGLNALPFLYALCLGLGIWLLWRKYSLRVLKLELSLFLAQFALQWAWSLSLSLLHEPLLALFALILLFCNTLVAMLLFWQKEKFAGILYALPLLWVSYLTFMNMMSCISNP